MSDDKNLKILKDVHKILESIKKEDIDAMSDYERVIFESELAIMKDKLADLQAKIG
jgi:hypothetical protein